MSRLLFILDYPRRYDKDEKWKYHKSKSISKWLSKQEWRI